MGRKAILSDTASYPGNIQDAHQEGINAAMADGTCKWIPLAAFNDAYAGGYTFAALPAGFTTWANDLMLKESSNGDTGIWAIWDTY